MKTQAPIIAGVDLAATPLNPTGWATLKGRVVSACHLFSDKEIVSKIIKCKPMLLAVDAAVKTTACCPILRQTDEERAATRSLNPTKLHT